MTAAGAATVLAVDVGTSGLKAVVFSADGTPRAHAVADYPTHTPRAGSREQDPADWWTALRTARDRLDLGQDLAAIVFSGTMQNCLAVGRDGQPLGRAILYSDAGVDLASRQACEARLPADVATRIGNAPDGAMPLFRLMGGDARLARGPAVHYQFGAKDVLVEQLTGRAAIDPTTATTTGLFDLRRRCWDPALLAAAGLAIDQLPVVLAADAIVGPLRAEAATALELPPGLPVVNGSGDAGAATWGAGGGAPGRVHAYLGTTGWVAAARRPADTDTPRDTYTLAAPAGPAVIDIAPLLQAGSVLDWLGGLGIAAAGEAGRIDKEPPSVLFLPYLAGERSPFQDRDVRGAFLGLDERTGPGALHYAALEGLCHAIRDNLLALGERPTVLPLIGGVAEDPTLRQLLADTLDVPVGVAPHPRLSTAYGAFLFAAAALGWDPPGAAGPPLVAPRLARRRRAERRFSAYRAAQATARTIAADLLAAPDDAPSPLENDP